MQNVLDVREVTLSLQSKTIIKPNKPSKQTDMEKASNRSNNTLVASIYKRYYTDILCYFRSYTQDVMAAEDMVQNLFVKVMAMDTITNDTAKNLLFVMAKRMIIDDTRHKAFVREAEKDLRQRLAFYTSSTVHRIEASNILNLLSSHLDTMASKRARIYKMHKWDGLTADEIAQQTNISKRTVESHIYLSSKEVKSFLEKIG